MARVGITGHQILRYPEDWPWVEAQLARALGEIERREGSIGSTHALIEYARQKQRPLTIFDPIARRIEVKSE